MPRQTQTGNQGGLPVSPQIQSSRKVESPEPSPPSEQSKDFTAVAAITEAFPALGELPLESIALSDLFKPSRHGGYRNHLNGYKAKLILATAPLLIDRILAKNESVHRIASGIAYFRFEIPYANGLLTWPLNYYALVATNYRLLLLNLDYHLTRPDRYAFQIPIGEITEISRGLYGSSLIIKTTEGQVWDFTTVKRELAEELSGFIQERLTTEEANTPRADFSPQLCPACFQPVPERILSCPHCLTPYKSASYASKKSLVLPGLGAFYLSFPSLGIAEMLGYLLTWLLTIILVIIGIPGGFFGGGLLILAYHLMSAFMASQMARKGYIPEQNFLDDSFSEENEATNTAN
ncbi:MAG: hypothetical protein HGA96_05540 [Desulfobulbaceae bacterium]|nr:hypothetical protein [Desulfobulbaceae bacterium]